MASASSNNDKSPKPADCHGCGKSCSSRNAVFRHLRETNGACLSSSDYDDFLHYVQTRDLQKTIILYGYIPSTTCGCEEDLSLLTPLVNGDDAARFLLEAVGQKEGERINRSYGSNVRCSDIVAQDEETGAVCEVLAVRLAGLTTSLEEWIDLIEDKLSTITSGDVRIFGRLDMPQKRFNAEQGVTHVRVEYLLPADFLFTGSSAEERDLFFDSFNDFVAGQVVEQPSPENLAKLVRLKKLRQLLTTKVVDLDTSNPSAVMEKEFNLQKRQRNRKKHQDKRRDKQHQERNEEKITSSDKVENGEYRTAKDTNDTNKHSEEHEENTNNEKSEKSEEAMNGNLNRNDKDKSQKLVRKKAGSRVLQRRRFHNFTPRVMAHEFLAYRRLDRFYHRATFRLDGEHKRPFLALCLTGDMFLQGQAVRVVGLWLALARNLIDSEIVDCIFDEEYPPLVPTPPAPTFALYAVEANYMTWEGKSKLILTPRCTDRYPNGWNNKETINAVADWHSHIHGTIAKAWMQKGVGEDGRLSAEREWTEQILEPWAEKAKEQLKEYRVWKASRSADTGKPAEAVLPPLESVDATVPLIFEKVLYYLREADASGLWPSTTPKRQLVMISNSTKDDGGTNSKSLSAAHLRARTNKGERASAYEFAEGQGRASGSFSIGAFPGDEHTQPKANALFPELMKHAFELEMALCPGREPSSTIAINRNAQFRPHTDSGAGAGQSKSLIVGLGHYVGGELVVEGEKKDIRYKGLEFNGWTERHWTVPFLGERYSLVWFTPKGCEGVRGIDLCK